MADRARLDDGPWPAPRGSAANDLTSQVALSGQGTVRWRADLPYHGVSGISVAADGTCFVSAGKGIAALHGPELRWSVETCAPLGSLVLDRGLLVTHEVGTGLVVREQQTGASVSTIEASLLSGPAVTSDGLLAFVTSRQDQVTLRASTLAGQAQWERKLQAWSTYPPLVQSDHIIIADGPNLRAFDNDGNAVWTANRHEFSATADPDDPDEAPAEVEGPLVGLRGNRVLAAFRAYDWIGYLVVDPRSGEVRALPAHLPAKEPAVPVFDHTLERDLLAIPGWPEEDSHGQFRPTLTIVDVDSGVTTVHHVLPEAVSSIVAGSNGLLAVAGSPTWDRWTSHHGYPGFDLAPDCYVIFSDKSGIRTEWRPGKPVTGPLAVGPDGDLLVPVSGELFSIE